MRFDEMLDSYGQGGKAGIVTYVVAVQPQLVAEQRARERGSGSGIAAERESLGDNVAIETNAEHSEGDSKVVADVVDVLLGVDEFVEGGDAIMAEELVWRSVWTLYTQKRVSTTHVVISSCVETGARSTDVLCGWWVKGMGGIAVCWDFDATNL